MQTDAGDMAESTGNMGDTSGTEAGEGSGTGEDSASEFGTSEASATSNGETQASGTSGSTADTSSSTAGTSGSTADTSGSTADTSSTSAGETGMAEDTGDADTGDAACGALRACFDPPTYVPLPNLEPRYLAAADLDADTQLDLLVTHNVGAHLQFARGDGTGGFEPQAAVGDSIAPTDIALGDLDDDEILDVVVTSTAGSARNVHLWWGDGAGNFAEGVVLNSGAAPEGVAVGALFEAGVPDVVVTANQTDGVIVLRNLGAGDFSSQAPRKIGAQPDDVIVTSLDADLAFDLAVSNTGDGTISIVYNASGMATVVTYVVDDGTGTGGPRGLAAGDFDGDGDIDVAVANEQHDQIAILRNDGQQVLQAPRHFASGSRPRSLVAADFDGNGLTDIVSANYGDASLGVLWQVEPGSFESSALSLDSPPWDLTMGDFDADGHADLAATLPERPGLAVVLSRP